MTRTQALQLIVQRTLPGATLRFDMGDEMLDDGCTALLEGTETEITVQYSGNTMIVHEWKPAEQAQHHHYTGKSVEQAGAAIVELLKAA